jgi:hypothetical protein
MSWVLILTSSLNARPPAVVGGYPTRAEAEAAGDEAVQFEPGAKVFPEFSSYVVIPGAACAEPVGSTHCRIEQYWDGKEMVARHIVRY